MELCIIYAEARMGVIGRKGPHPLLWDCPSDLRHFKRTTDGYPIIMGRHTYESLPGKLPNRLHVVVSSKVIDDDEVISVKSLDEAVSKLTEAGVTKAFVIGGISLIEEAMGKADTIMRTVIDVQIDVEGELITVNPPDPEVYFLGSERRDPLDSLVEFQVWERLE